MKAVRTLENITGPTLTVNVPSDFAGMQVEVIILPLQRSEQHRPDLDARHLLPKPSLTEEDKALFANHPYPLRGMASHFADPFEPIVPAEDWEAIGNDLE